MARTKAADPLATYRAKRDFSKTPEPPPERKRKSGNSFVVQKHAATRTHFDFRLEHDGVLKSWAVTKGPSLDPAQKRLAVMTEDHPLEYGKFEGVIPKREYGGGPVMLWDRGTWEPIGDPDEGLAKGDLKFRLNGDRLNGDFVLVRMKPRKEDRGRQNWLLIKKRDEYAGDGDEPTLTYDTSVKSGRTMDQIEHGESAVWSSNKAKKKLRRRRKRPRAVTAKPKRRKSPARYFQGSSNPSSLRSTPRCRRAGVGCTKRSTTATASSRERPATMSRCSAEAGWIGPCDFRPSRRRSGRFLPI